MQQTVWYPRPTIISPLLGLVDDIVSSSVSREQHCRFQVYHLSSHLQMFYPGSKQPALVTYAHRKPCNTKWKWHDIKPGTENEVWIGQAFLQYINCLYYTAVRSLGCKSMRFTTTSSYTQEYYILFGDPRAGPGRRIKISPRPTLWRKGKKPNKLNKHQLFTCS